MNRGNPHRRMGVNRSKDRRTDYSMGSSPYQELDTGPGLMMSGGPRTRGRGPMSRRPTMTAGYDGGNTRPRGPDGRPLPFNQYPSRNVPVPIMDYTGSMTASMDPGSKYNGTYKQEGYGDPRFDDFGQEEYYDTRDYYMDDVIDPGLSGYDRGPLYFS